MIRYGSIQRLRVRGKLSAYYYVRVRYADGRRSWKTTGVRSKALARQVVDTMRRQAAAGIERHEPVAVGPAVREFLRARKARLAHRSYLLYRTYMRHTVRLLGDLMMDRVALRDIEEYFRRRAAEGAAGVTLNHERTFLRCFWRWACDHQYATANPLDRYKRHPQTRRGIRVLSAEEERRLLARARERGEWIYSFVLCLMQTGMRRGTVSQLRWEHIDWERGTWKVPAEIMKSREAFLGRPIPKAILEYLTAHRAEKGLIWGAFRSGPWRWVCEHAGVPWLRPHDLRRNFVTRCRRAGLGLEETMWLSDHRDLRVVQECYRLVDASDVAEKVAGLWR